MTAAAKPLWPEPTLRELVAGLAECMRDVERKIDAASRRYHQGEAGSDTVNSARVELGRLRGDLRHWREEHRRWSRMLARYPEDADKPAAVAHGKDWRGEEPAGKPQTPARPAPPPEPKFYTPGPVDRRSQAAGERDREPGEDDGDEADSPLPF